MREGFVQGDGLSESGDSCKAWTISHAGVRKNGSSGKVKIKKKTCFKEKGSQKTQVGGEGLDMVCLGLSTFVGGEDQLANWEIELLTGKVGDMGSWRIPLTMVTLSRWLAERIMGVVPDISFMGCFRYDLGKVLHGSFIILGWVRRERGAEDDTGTEIGQVSWWLEKSQVR
jgi:hypothetical protein